ncbi:MAG: hypothetical protein FJ248_00250 [Nitrospira sp.]|nr:hypothetical protein [Nitrospira sp.]
MHRWILRPLPSVSALVLLLTLLTAGCAKIGWTRAALPDMGPKLPMTAALTLDPSLTSTEFTYTDNCGRPNIPVALGQILESALTDAADQTFKTVELPGKKPSGVPADVSIHVVLEQQGFKVNQEALYDRVPAELVLEAVALFRDPSGKVLGEIPLKVTHRDRVYLEVTQKRCDYLMEPFASGAAVSLATLFARASRDVMDPASRAAAAGAGPSGTASALVFKATLLDENSDGFLERGERVKVRVDLTNSGTVPVTGVNVTLNGLPALLSGFSSTTLSAGGLQPGESRSVEFAATIPQALESQKAELTVAVSAATGSSAPLSQALTASVRSGAARFDSIDQIPAGTGLQRPHTYVLAVGVSSYRDPQLAARKYSSLDAELTAAYFQAVGGVPLANIKLLQDWKALRPDIEDTILEWLPKRLSSDSVVIVYFSGHAAVSPSGETYLVPYDGKANSTARLYPLKDLEAGLVRLKAKQTIFIFDGGILPIGPAGSKARGPQWSGTKSPVLHLIGAAGLQSGLEPPKLRHGLFTYYLLRGLKGEADTNLDGDITLGELTAFVGRTVPAVARQEFNQEQHPLFVPPLPLSSAAAGLVLSKSATR